MAENGVKRVTYFSKKAIECPVCGSKFYREDLLTGGQRLIAGALTEELRRKYEPTAKYGEVNPLLYTVTVCPVCYYAAYPKDFLGLDEGTRIRFENDTEKRQRSISILFGDLDFTESRRLYEGVASYFFSLMCYNLMAPQVSPTFKKGLSSLRAAWLSNDLHSHFPGENYEKLAKLFYRKASYFYGLTIQHEQNAVESLDGVTTFGPDTDKNYGYDSILYLKGLLDYKYGSKADVAKRINKLEQSKRFISKVFGIGKASKAKPSSILDIAKDLYDQMTEEVDKLQAESG